MARILLVLAVLLASLALVLSAPVDPSQGQQATQGQGLRISPEAILAELEDLREDMDIGIAAEKNGTLDSRAKVIGVTIVSTHMNDLLALAKTSGGDARVIATMEEDIDENSRLFNLARTSNLIGVALPPQVANGGLRRIALNFQDFGNNLMTLPGALPEGTHWTPIAISFPDEAAPSQDQAHQEATPQDHVPHEVTPLDQEVTQQAQAPEQRTAILRRHNIPHEVPQQVHVPQQVQAPHEVTQQVQVPQQALHYKRQVTPGLSELRIVLVAFIDQLTTLVPSFIRP